MNELRCAERFVRMSSTERQTMTKLNLYTSAGYFRLLTYYTFHDLTTLFLQRYLDETSKSPVAQVS